MNIHVLSVKDKVQRYLTDAFKEITVDKDGDFALRIGSSQMWISVAEVKETENNAAYIAVRVFANTNNKVPATSALFEYVATQGRYPFGALRCYRKDDGVRVFLEHTLMGDYLDPSELMLCIGEIARVANTVDDQIKAKFGGNVYHEVSK